MIQQCALDTGFIKWMAGRQQLFKEMQSTSKCAPSMDSRQLIYTIARGTIANSEASTVTSPVPMKLVKSYKLENGWICCRYLYYKYGVLVIDLELGMFLEYSCIFSPRNYVTTKTPKKGRSCTVKFVSEFFISAITMHLFIQNLLHLEIIQYLYHKDKRYASPDCKKVK